MDAPRYWAFISYSHGDRETAGWLRRAIEAYRVPSRLVGRTGAQGPIPARLFPVFRDRDELPGSSDLGAVIHAALRDSRFLIVIASPRAAQSRWVDQEIRSFLALGRSKQVLALICDGEPNAKDPAQECFPPALRERWDDEGRRAEPLAADLREGYESRRSALLRIIAGMLGVGLDELRQRDRQRRRWQRVGWVIASVLAASSLLTVWSLRGVMQEERERLARIERFQARGEQALIDGESGQAAAWLGEAYRMGGNSLRLRMQLAQALQPFAARVGWLQAAAAPVDRVALSEDGRRLVSISGRRWLEIWDLPAGRRVAAHALEPSAIGDLLARPAFSKDGRYLQWIQQLPGADEPHRVRVFDAERGALLQELPTAASHAYHPDSPFSPDGALWLNVTPDRRLEIYRVPEFRLQQSWSPPGRLRVASFVNNHHVVTGAHDGQVSRWRLLDARQDRRFDGLKAPITSLAVAAENGRLAVGAGYGPLRVWDLATGRLDLAGGHRFTVMDVRFARASGRYLSIADDGVRVWDGNSGALTFVSREPLRRRKWAELAPDGLTLASSNEGAAAIWDVTAQQQVFSFNGHRGGVFDLSYRADGERLITGGADGGIGIWRTPALPLRWHAHGEALRPEGGVGLVDGDFAPDGEHYLIGGTDGVLALYRLGETAPVRELPTQAASVEFVRWSSDGQRLLTVTENGEVRRWTLSRGEEQGEAQSISLGRQVSGPHDLAISSDTRWLALPAADPRTPASWFDVETGRTATLNGAAMALAFRPGHRQLAVSGEALQLTEIPEGRLLWRQPDVTKVRALGWAADGRMLAAANEAGDVYWLDAETGAVVHRVPTGLPGQPVILAAQVNGSTLAVADASGHLVLVDRHSAMVRPLTTVISPVLDLQFSADGQRLLVGTEDGAVRLWSTEDARPLLLLGRHSGGVNRVQFGRDDEVVLSVGADNRAALWPLQVETRAPETLAAWMACRVAWRVVDDTLQAASPGPCPD